MPEGFPNAVEYLVGFVCGEGFPAVKDSGEGPGMDWEEDHVDVIRHDHPSA